MGSGGELALIFSFNSSTAVSNDVAAKDSSALT